MDHAEFIAKNRQTDRQTDRQGQRQRQKRVHVQVVKTTRYTS